MIKNKRPYMGQEERMVTIETLLAEQADLRRRLDALKQTQTYQREAAAEDRRENRQRLVDAEEGQLAELLTYMRRRPGITYEQALEDTGIGFAVGATLDCNGRLGGEREDYERTDDETMRTMLQTCEADGFSPKQIAHFKQLVAEGMDYARAYAVAASWDSMTGQERRPQGRPNPYESRPAAPVSDRPGKEDLDSSFIRSTGSWSAAASANDYGTAAHIAAPAFKNAGHAGQRPQGIPRPAGHGLSPAGYSRRADGRGAVDASGRALCFGVMPLGVLIG
jgi:hypothetical protein